MPYKIKSRYSASFTAGSLLHKETTALLPLLQSDNAEQRIREEVKNNEILHINSESARKRIVFEVIKRKNSVYPAFWDFYALSSEEEQKILLFFLCLRTYPLMFDFHFNVTLRVWNSSSQMIDPYYYQMEVEEIGIRDEVVAGWSDVTKKKAIRVYLRILKEIKLLDKNNRLQAIDMVDQFWSYFVRNQYLWFLEACLLSNLQKERLIQ